MSGLKESPQMLFRHRHTPGIHRLEGYQKAGGYEAAKQALEKMKPQEVIETVKASGLRGRGGAGFPTGMKWGFIPKNQKQPPYLLCNGDESEPGTFKDRILMEEMPHLLIEGMIIASYAIGARKAYIYLRGEYTESQAALNQAIAECHRHKILGKQILGSTFDLDIYTFMGAGAYICGEEMGLIRSIEGWKGYPRLKPPFPALSGFNGRPTIINNVETLAAVPWIIARGADAYRKVGTEKSPGTKLFCLSGPVNRPGTYELPLGIPMRDLIYTVGGGLKDGLKLKAVIPGGVSAPVLTAAEADQLHLSYESCAEAGTMLGSGGVIVIADNSCMVDLMSTITYFFKDESCGQCTPCREGTGWMHKIVTSILAKRGREADIPLLSNISSNLMGGRTICALADAAALPVKSFVEKFSDEFQYHITRKRCHLHVP